MKILGGLLFLFGVADLVGSRFMDVDIWTDYIKVELPEMVWRYSAYIEMGLGLLVMRLGGKSSSDDE